MKSVKISIIVPVYNCDKYLERCIDSILKQTFKDFELILLNDGSVDRSLDICKSYEGVDSRVRVISHKNMGVSKTRQKGLKLAKGNYIAFIDSDDRIELEYLEKLYEAIADENVNVVCCNSNDSNPSNEDIYIKNDEYISENYKLLEAYFEKKRYAYCIWGKLFKKQDLDKVIFPEMKYSEDAYVVQTIFSNSDGVKLLKYAGYYYTDNPNGAMRRSKGLQEPLDSLKCTVYISDICMKKYPDLIKMAKERLVMDSFSLLINSSIESIEVRRSIDKLLKHSCDMIGNEFLKQSKKGYILLVYQKLPIMINLLLKGYYKIKHNVLKNIIR
ncbi:glycosyltransferase family 2 protein [uncultured Clostridium sp.]|uniref:glycosyltransferase family 2 protein n=1 Tax=uncultured Clostridium sp. TaxID=59620 RepID=UPI002593F17F|nr:glycosyltransferase family 2 protein [uncultured Clostridium sp.]